MMAARHYTALGEPIDMAALVIKHSSAVALGNAKMNARGDVLGTNGVVLKTQEQIEAEWQQHKAAQTNYEQLVDIKSQSVIPVPPVKKVLGDDQDFNPDTSVSVDASPVDSVPPRRRKTVDAE